MSKALKILKYFGIAVLGLTVTAVLAILIAGSTVTLEGERLTPAGVERNDSVYVTMRDGVRIAIDIWRPTDLAADDKVPTLIRATRYGRAYNIGFGYRVLIAFGQASGDPNLRPDIRVLNTAGYAVVRVDARGSGASFGHRAVEWSEAEVADYGEIVDWIIRQPWSNGRVGAYGVSYDGNAAELIAVPNHPAVVAVAPMFSYFDPFEELIRPGGVFDDWFISRWSRITKALDTRLPCDRGTRRCLREKWFSDGIKPVDADRDRSLRSAAVTGRANPEVLASLAQVEFRDDAYGATGMSLDARSPYRLADEIAASGVAMNVWAGWFDSGTVDGAIARFKTLPNPQRLIIAPLTHGGKHDSDPFAPADRPASMDMETQYRMLAGFFDPFLKEGLPPDSLTREIRYYTLGEGVWKSTTQWPPAGVSTMRWYFAPEGALSPDASETPEGSDRYQVDFTATTGKRSRWHTINGPDVVYADRREAGQKLLTYTSAPLDRDIEITGNPVVRFHVAASRPDSAFHVYLESVAPDGAVTYLTEGILRAQNRKVSTDAPPYAVVGPYHSLERADAEPLTPGAVTEIAVSLYAISALVPKGHAIRVALAGANADIFERIPADGELEWQVHRSRAYPSHVDLPWLVRD